MSLLAEDSSVSSAENNASDGAKSSFRYVTSMNLKRSFLEGDIKHCKLIIKEDPFRNVVAFGLQNGVTWDEVVRALIDRELTSNEPFAGLSNYLP